MTNQWTRAQVMELMIMLTDHVFGQLGYKDKGTANGAGVNYIGNSDLQLELQKIRLNAL